MPAETKELYSNALFVWQVAIKHTGGVFFFNDTVRLSVSGLDLYV
jgi:hypothetical protein